MTPRAATLCALATVLAGACTRSEPLTATPMGEPLPGLSARQQSRFDAGRVLFDSVFTPATGLGPLFNDNQCSACHTSPATGGTGDQFVTRVSRTRADGSCDALVAAGGENVRLRTTPALRAHGIERQPFPADATDTVRFNVPFVFGMGLIEAVPEEHITARADPEDRDGDGISGRTGRDAQGRFARFGRMADQPTLRAFIEHAAHLEMGLTTPTRPHESLGTVTLPPGADPAPDPELGEDDVALLEEFVRFLGPPARLHGADAADSASIARGEALFERVGCTGCHTPVMETGPSDVAALDRRRFALYSDLLLHDLGPTLAGVCTSAASTTERRTEPLMGLGRRGVYLHDSRTNDLTEAILLHGGEATLARERFRALGELQQHDLIRFLRSL